MCGIMRITFSLRSGTVEVNQMFWQNWGDPRLIAKTLIDTDDSAAVYDESGYSEERATVQMIMRIMGRRAVPERQEALNWI